ncbi:MAG: Cyclic di-GMP phosphodiesterase Gmr [bacterium ADurb.Bin429]|nr:MAG: Cyclic di-GMP phosphodiesterase Gmr [bacterium ADurb.Bin429]
MLYQDRLTQAIARARRAGTALAVMLLDLDRFKSVNDSLGHLAGDVLLQEVAARLRACVRQEDTVARQGGDEFILLLPEIAHPEDALRVANKILDAFQHPFVISGHELYVTVSIGIAIFPTDGNDHGALIQNADVALYQAKEQGRNAYRLYTPAMNAHALERLDMEAHLRRAIEREEFRLVYQPRVHVLTGEITSVEALIRWEHPERGTIPPGQFIPLAEETGLIAPIGEWVLHATHARLRAWHEAGLPPLRVAVNVSGRQLSTGSLIPVLHAIVRDCPGAASLLELEITESVAMTNVEETLAVLRDLHAMGFWIAIDDFGTSYSSLNYLKQFPIHALKVDQSFVREIPGDPNSEAIAATIIGMAHSLQLHVIAEGVETAEQLDFLACHECDEVQGYYYSRPLPPDDFVRTFFVDGAFTTNVPVG